MPKYQRYYSLAELEAMPTVCVGQADDLKVEKPGFRVWLSRCDTADGEPHENKVTIEEWRAGEWENTEYYQAR